MTAKFTDPGTRVPLVAAARVQLAEQLEMFQRVPGEYFSRRPATGPNSTELAFLDAVPEKHRRAQYALWAQSIQLGRLLCTNTHDAVNSLRRLLTEDELPLFAYLTLSRVACESAATVLYLFDAAIGSQTRLLRGGALLYADALHVKSIAADLGPVNRQQLEASAQEDIDRLTGQIDAAGIVIEKDRKHKPWKLTLGSRSAPLKLDLTQHVAAAFPDRPGVYRITSGAVHGSHAALNARTTAATAGMVAFQVDLADIALAVSLVIEAIGKILAALAAYYGVDGQDEARDTQRRIEIMNRYAAEAGLASRSLGAARADAA